MIKRGLKIVLEFGLLFICVNSIRYSEEVTYGLAQAKGQLHILWNTQEVENVLKDPVFPDSLKAKLKFIGEIRHFAFDSLGLVPNENYTTFYDMRGQPALWVVSACEPYSFKAREWSFPIAGSFPYKGFFKKEKAEKEAEQLEQQNYDVDFGTVGGWSTLGWFKDPVLSNMLYRPEGRLSDLIIHELTHGTLYVKSNANFNENLASFIGEKGAIRFLKNKFGEGAKELSDYLESKSDETLYTNYILGATENLDQLYKSFKPADSKEIKEQIKQERIVTLIRGINSLPFIHPEKYSNAGKNIMKEKNAYFMQYQRYDAQKSHFEKELNEKFNGDIKKYLNYLKEKYPAQLN